MAKMFIDTPAHPELEEMLQKITPPKVEWTQIMPIVPGFYWYYDEHWTEGDIRMVEVRMVDLARGVGIYYFFAGNSLAFDHTTVGTGSYWWGPIEPPTKV